MITVTLPAAGWRLLYLAAKYAHSHITLVRAAGLLPFGLSSDDGMENVTVFDRALDSLKAQLVSAGVLEGPEGSKG